MTKMATVTSDELKEIRSLRDSLANIISVVGELSLSKMVLMNELKQIEENIKKEEEKFIEFQKQERVIFEKMQQKYGTGNIDVNTGEILA